MSKLNFNEYNAVRQPEVVGPVEGLSSSHLAILHAAAISDAVILERGYRTVTVASELEQLGFNKYQLVVPGLLLPLHTTGGDIGLFVYRPDFPRIKHGQNENGEGHNSREKAVKYELPEGSRMRLDCPPRCQTKLNDPAIDLWITEGQKKADSLASAGICAIGLLGVWNFKGKNNSGGTTWLADWDYVALGDRQVYIVFDSDVMNKPQVQKALNRLTEHLKRKKANVHTVLLPQAHENKKVGVDDWLAQGNSVEELYSLSDQPEQIKLPTPPTYEILDSSPLVIQRPLSLIQNNAYAAVWIYVKKSSTESLVGKDNGQQAAKNNPEKQLHLVRDDGILFGPAGNKDIAELGFTILLTEPVPEDKGWSGSGVRKYQAGLFSTPIDVFHRIRTVIDQHVDFHRSLADQETMLDFCACFTLSTWFQEAFNVTGYLWANGEKGSGKSNFIQVVAQLSYLGEFLLAGGTYATLRDLADYGATLAFDDAENITNAHTVDADKRTLMLSGNHRGSVITVKEPIGTRGYRTRRVNAFSPKLFSSIQQVEPVLASRTIVVPLTRTLDRKRANADPADFESWQEDRRGLLDDLWALALNHLPEVKKFDTLMATQATLQGRPLQPWRPTLAIARWLQDLGEDELFSRMDQLSVGYQEERNKLELADFTLLVIHAILEYASPAISAIYASQQEINGKESFVFTISQIVIYAKEITVRDEWDIDLSYIDNWKIGKTLASLRLEEVARPTGRGSRRRKITLQELIDRATAHGINLPSPLKEINDRLRAMVKQNGVSGGNGVSQSSNPPYPMEDTAGKNSTLTQSRPRLVELVGGTKVCHSCGEANWEKCTDSNEVHCATCHPG